MFHITAVMRRRRHGVGVRSKLCSGALTVFGSYQLNSGLFLSVHKHTHMHTVHNNLLKSVLVHKYIVVNYYSQVINCYIGDRVSFSLAREPRVFMLTLVKAKNFLLFRYKLIDANILVQ